MKFPCVLILNWRDPANPLAGGGETHVWEVFGRALDRGWDVKAICSGFPGSPNREIVDGTEVYRCGSDYTYPAAVPWAYRCLTKSYKPDIVVDIMDKLPLMTPLYVKEPIVSFVHHFFGDAAPLEVALPLAKVIQFSERLVPRFYSRTPFLTGSQSTAEELIDLGISANAVNVVPYGVHLEDYSVGPKSDVPTICYVGRLKAYKHIDHLIEVAPALLREFPDLRIHIVGRGDDEPRLKSIVRRSGLDECVYFHGFLSEEKKREIYASSWIATLLSAKEGFGLSIPEAALCGTLSVGYDVAGVRDAIRDEETGLLVPYAQTDQLEEALVGILRDEQRRKTLSENARAHYSDFSWDKAAAETLDAIEGIVHDVSD